LKNIIPHCHFAKFSTWAFYALNLLNVCDLCLRIYSIVYLLKLSNKMTKYWKSVNVGSKGPLIWKCINSNIWLAWNWACFENDNFVCFPNIHDSQKGNCMYIFQTNMWWLTNSCSLLRLMWPKHLCQINICYQMKWPLPFDLHYFWWKIVINQGCISHLKGCKLQSIHVLYYTNMLEYHIIEILL